METNFRTQKSLLILALGFVLFPTLSIAAEPNYNCDLVKKQILEASGVSINSQFIEGLERSSADENYVRKSFLPTFQQILNGQKLTSEDPLYSQAMKLFNEWDLADQALDTKDHLKKPQTESLKRTLAARKALNDFQQKHEVVVSKYRSGPIEVTRLKDRKVLKIFLDGNRAAIELAKKMNAFDYAVIGEDRYDNRAEAVPKKMGLESSNYNRKVDLYEVVYPQTKGTKSKVDNISVVMFESDDVRDRQWSVLMHGSAFHIKCNSSEVVLHPEKCGVNEVVRHEKFCAMFDRIKKPIRPTTYPTAINGKAQKLPFQSETLGPLRRGPVPNEDDLR